MLIHKRIIMLVILLTLVCYISPVLASSTVSKVFINDRLVRSDLKVKQMGDTLLIPVEILTEGFNLEVDWKNLIKTVNIKYDDKVIKLRAGESKVQVGDRIKELSSDIRLEKDRVLIPVDFISKILGYKVDWTDNTLQFSKPSGTVKDITYENQKFGEAIKIEITEQLDYEIKQLTAPDRLLIDIYDSKLAEDIDDIAVNNGSIFQIRSGQFNPGVTRVVLDLYQPLDYRTEVINKNGDCQLILKMNSKITGFKYDNNKGLFSISATDELNNYKTEFDKDNKKMIVKFPNMILDVVKDKFVIDNELVKNVNLTQLEKEGIPVIKVIFKMKKWFELDIEQDSENNNLLLLRPERRVELIDVNYDSQAGEVRIKTEYPVTPQVVPLEKGDRLVADFPNAVFRDLSQNITIEDEFIEEIRIAQFNKELVRTVIDLEKLVDYELESRVDKETDDYVTVVKLDSPKNLKSQAEKDIAEQETEEKSKQLRAVDITQQNQKTSMQVKLNTDSNYEIRKFNYPDRLVIDIPGAAAALKPTEITEAKGVIKDVRVSQFSRNPMIARVVFELSHAVDYQVVSEEETNEINLQIQATNSNNLNLVGKTIVIDAGHGGADPGAIGAGGTMEKDVNLDVAKKLASLLKEAGAKIRMTRKEDKYVTLWDRANEANELNCDIFVSIHANAHQKKKASGSETYVYPGSYGDNLVLAKKVQGSLHEKLGTPDRGVRFDKFYVLENTTMPSILVEIGFLTNSHEERLLASSSFKQKAAEGMYKGIVDFFSRTGKEEGN
ncbi:N-acetylmuramoyl-L-alanine amidase family protein [Acetohalobium arabaticum]|uniref:N-acetylmuramoyl-L-alanine amidase n=1 Tax=Acetohalobium arabaticum (strain ATCC 49924 / DSM 5501 / Z-7288) TaxID=574087 RepID=D9QS22_ACEAZ|nr:N-acetylmuramoyl-L-alanine amidase family protein [Acetohalobium arabaticum]ADL13313.1 N-acetylmuramoyl-L-alanine amidase [Acetohalobium arabaticum DSM 5501]